MKKCMAVLFGFFIIGLIAWGQADELNYNINGTHSGTVKFASVEFLSSELGLSFEVDDVQVGMTYPAAVSDTKRFDHILEAGIGAADPSENWVANSVEKVELKINSDSMCEMYLPVKNILVLLHYSHDKNMWAATVRFDVERK